MEKEFKVIYLCDRKQCKQCSYPNCKHTTDIKHAKNFNIEYLTENYFEKENEDLTNEIKEVKKLLQEVIKAIGGKHGNCKN